MKVTVAIHVHAAQRKAAMPRSRPISIADQRRLRGPGDRPGWGPPRQVWGRVRIFRTQRLPHCRGMTQSLLVFIGPSGSGKSTIVRTLVERRVVTVHPTWTTRPRRADEAG